MIVERKSVYVQCFISNELTEIVTLISFFPNEDNFQFVWSVIVINSNQTNPFLCFRSANNMSNYPIFIIL